VHYSDPVTRVRETVEVVRALLRDGIVSYRGKTITIEKFDLWFKITSRYLLQARDGAVATTGESFREMISSTEARDSQILNDNMGRVFIKIRPKRIRAWDFSKAPIGWMD
jgi:hypothetical protein